MAFWFVDNSVALSGNGQSWATAWKNIANVVWASVLPGDTVFISGGATSQTYTEILTTPASGTVGNLVTVSTGQDAGHNGTVIFDGGGTLANWLVGSLAFVHITGNVGGANHMKVENFTDNPWFASGTGVSISNFRLSYIDFPSMIAGLRVFNGTTFAPTLELDHLFLEKNTISTIADDVIYLAGAETASPNYDQILIHDNQFLVPASNVDAAFGDDCIKWGNGISFYNNRVKTVLGPYPRGQHADIFQIGNSRYKIFNNVFEDVGESVVYHDQFTVPTNAIGLLFFNNLVVNSHVPGSGVARALDFQPEGAGVGTTFTDFITVNNTFVDWTRGVFLIRYNNAASYTNCFVKNNIFKNCVIGTALDPGVVESNDTFGNVQFVNYAPFAVVTNDLHLSSNDVVARDQGVALTVPAGAGAAYLVDRDGVSRPQGPAWDIGAFEFTSFVPPSPPPSTFASARSFVGA